MTALRPTLATANLDTPPTLATANLDTPPTLATANLDTPPTLATAEGTAPAPIAQATNQEPTPTAQTEPATPEPTPTPAAAPPAPAAAQASQQAPVPAAAAGAAFDINEPAIYQFNGQGHSLVLDLIHSRIDGDRDAADRLHQFNTSLDKGDKTNVIALANAYALPRMGVGADLATAAVIKEADMAANFMPGPQLASQLLLKAIDKGRPFVSRLRTLPISNGSPFKVPTIGEFDGTTDHVEGTTHVADGTITVGGDIVDPTAVSGAWRLSRELAESTGPRIDLLVVPEMVADYHQRSEVRVVAKLAAAKPAYDAASVDTADELDQSLIDFYLARYQTPTVIGMGTTAYPLYAKLKASDGRPYYPHYNPTNAAGRAETGLTAIDVQGVAAVPAWSAVATDIWEIYGPDVWVFESAPRTFRFEEVEGPGIIKLAIWGYQAAHVARVASVRRLKTIA